MDSHTIDTAQALSLAQDMHSLVTTIRNDMDTLNTAITQNIPSQVETEWSDRVRSNWERYYNSDIKDVLEQIKQTAEHVISTAEETERYSHA